MQSDDVVVGVWHDRGVTTTAADLQALTDSDLESSVRYYGGVYPAVFARARGSRLWDDEGREYLDFFCGAGALNLGHNEPVLKRAVIDYLEGDGLLHALDLETPARALFRDSLSGLLQDHDLPYKFLAGGPTGANAVEAALKLARRVTGRTGVIAFTGGFHGMSLGALSVSSNRSSRAGAGTALRDVTFVPFPGAGTPWAENSLAYLVDLLDDTHSGLELPAAVIIESVQAEGGVNPAPPVWLRGLADICSSRGILLISDDIQVGCSRTGTFFSFEVGGVVPDIVVMAKAVSGLGLPISLVLYRRELDVFQPGEHNGTFRGNQLAFVSAAANLPMLDDPELKAGVIARGEHLRSALAAELAGLGLAVPVRGRGLIVGVDLSTVEPMLGTRVVRACFQRGLIVEAAGRQDQVVKLLPPLNVSFQDLDNAAATVGASIAASLTRD